MPPAYVKPPEECCGRRSRPTSLNRVLFKAFCEDHPAELVPRNILRQLVQRARADGRQVANWREYRPIFSALNTGGGVDGIALNAFQRRPLRP
ncbi:hypothetical protein NKI82_26130 [Mesorhizobium sp. M0482]|uniref:hypothetical protein n=1 Tax=Mesorhizobium sp. M0482 TaxID=2956948 RepID=UPI003335AC0D